MPHRVIVGLAAFAFAAALLGAYVGGYLWLGRLPQPSPVSVFSPMSGKSSHELRRIYPRHWQAAAFRPLARIESWLRGENVVTDSSDDLVIY